MGLTMKLGLAIAFVGVILITCVAYGAQSKEQQARYRVWFIISMVMMGIGTILQQVAS